MPLYSLALLAAIVLASPYWLARMLVGGRYRDGLWQRRGCVPRQLRQLARGRETIWVHAVSVGEVTAAGRLIELLGEVFPAFQVVVSTTTRTGQQLAQQRYGTARVFYFPLDFAWIVRRYLRALRPRTIVLMESELWPRLLVEAARAKVPVIVVNGRISDRSLPRYRALRVLWRPLLKRLALVLAQTEEDRARFVALGVPEERVHTAGNLKYDVRVDHQTGNNSEVTQMLREHLPPDAQMIVAGSTLEGEESMLANAFRELCVQFPRLVLVLAPRHPQRFDTVARLLTEARLPVLRRSQWVHQPQAIPFGSVFLLDSIGELSSVYSLSSVAFVGGSLVPPGGGHNPLEPAQFGVPIATGPYTQNFRAMMALLLEHNAIRVTPPERLAATLGELLTSAEARQMGSRARSVFEDQAGASARCLAAIQSVLQKASTQPSGSPASSESSERASLR